MAVDDARVDARVVVVVDNDNDNAHPLVRGGTGFLRGGISVRRLGRRGDILGVHL